MNQKKLKKMKNVVLNKRKWKETLARLIDVLKINISVIDDNGTILIPPKANKYGSEMVVNPSFGLQLRNDAINFFGEFRPFGKYREYTNQLDLHFFSFPLKLTERKEFIYVLVGPVILNKKHEKSEYRKLAKGMDVGDYDLFNEINDIRIVSNVMMNSILNLLFDVISNNPELYIKVPEIERHSAKTEEFSHSSASKEDISCDHVKLDNILRILLDIALRMTGTECGSIMVLDGKKGFLRIKAAKGLDQSKVEDTRVKLGYGIAGIAAKENSMFVIRGHDQDTRISHLLKRPEIKLALVMPLLVKNKVFGVLNLHTKHDDCKIEDNLNDLQHLFKLFFSTF